MCVAPVCSCSTSFPLNLYPIYCVLEDFQKKIQLCVYVCRDIPSCHLRIVGTPCLHQLSGVIMWHLYNHYSKVARDNMKL